MYKGFSGNRQWLQYIEMKMLGCIWMPAQFAESASLFVSWSLLLSALLIGQQWALFLQMAPQSAVYLASSNLWVYANWEPGWGPTSVRILTTMFCFGGSMRGVCLGGRRGVRRGGLKVAVSVCVVAVFFLGGRWGWWRKRLSAWQSILCPAGTAGGLHSALRALRVWGRPLL